MMVDVPIHSGAIATAPQTRSVLAMITLQDRVERTKNARLTANQSETDEEILSVDRTIEQPDTLAGCLMLADSRSHSRGVTGTRPYRPQIDSTAFFDPRIIGVALPITC